MDGIVEAFQKTNISIVQRIEYILTRTIPDHDLDRYLLMLKRQSRSKSILEILESHGKAEYNLSRCWGRENYCTFHRGFSDFL